MAAAHYSRLLLFVLLLLLLGMGTCFASPLNHVGNVFRDSQQQDSRLNSTEPPAEHIDLTALVNTLINTSQSGSRQLFSLLSVASYSSLALHRLTLLVYNISGVGSVDTHSLRRRLCYCVSNTTNDLTDFAAVLLDVMGNSTSYLHELFKSASILSVSQRNNSDCIYICVMAGKKGEEESRLWRLLAGAPLFNKTIIEGPRAGVNGSSVRTPPEEQQLPFSSRVLSTAHVSSVDEEPSGPVTALSPPVVALPAATAAPQTPRTPATPGSLETPATATPPPLGPAAATVPPAGDRLSPGASDGVQTRTGTLETATVPALRLTAVSMAIRATIPVRPKETLGCSRRVATVDPHQLQSCVLELCRFFSQCLCWASAHKTHTKRYCSDSHMWYKKLRAEVCRRVQRVYTSRSLKQRCLVKMCDTL